jgi:hypothetical protein
MNLRPLYVTLRMRLGTPGAAEKLKLKFALKD